MFEEGIQLIVIEVANQQNEMEVGEIRENGDS